MKRVVRFTDQRYKHYNRFARTFNNSNIENRVPTVRIVRFNLSK